MSPFGVWYRSLLWLFMNLFVIHNFHIFVFLTDFWHLRATDLHFQAFLVPTKVKLSILYYLAPFGVWYWSLLWLFMNLFVIDNFSFFVFLTDFWHLRTTDLQVQSHLEPLKVKLSYNILFVSIWCMILVVAMIVYEFICDP